MAKSKKVGQYFARGKEISHKQVKIFSSELMENDIPSPTGWDDAVTDSTGSPFSDKLMLYQVNGINAIGISYYGTSLATTLRRDLSANYIREMADLGKYAEDGVNLMIEMGWMEEPPRAIDHNELIKK